MPKNQWCEQFSRYQRAGAVAPVVRIGVGKAGLGAAAANPRRIRRGFRWAGARFGPSSSSSRRASGHFRRVRSGPTASKSLCRDHFQEVFQLDVGHGKAVQGALGGMAQLEPGPGQGGQHGVEVEVVAGGGAGLAGGQPQMLLGVAEVELDLEAVAVDAVNPFRVHLRVGGEQGGGPGHRRGDPRPRPGRRPP